MLFKECRFLVIGLLMACAFYHAVASAEIQHAGQISQDETWDSSDVHLVTGDILVPPGITLTISLGAVVNFSALSDSGNLGADPTRCEIIVDGGTLRIEAVSDSLAQLGSNAAVPAPGDWQGIRVLNNGELSMQGARVMHAVTAVHYQQNGPVTRNPLIRSSFLEMLSSDGIRIESQGGAQITASIENNEIPLLGGHGIYIKSSEANTLTQGSIVGNSIMSGLNGINLNAENQARNDLLIDQNSISAGLYATNTEEGAGLRIYHNGAYGGTSSDYRIFGNFISGSASDGVHINNNNSDLNISVFDNLISSSSQRGFYATNYTRTLNVAIKNNQITSSGAEGVLLQNGDQAANLNASLTYNWIYQNDGHGLALRDLQNATLFYNSIHDNTGQGIQVDSSRLAVINFNNIYGNDAASGIAIYNNGSAAVDARYNWWGDAIFAQINAGDNPRNLGGIHDFYDDGAKGVVDYGDWLSVVQTEPLVINGLVSWIKDPTEGQVIDATSYRIGGVAVSLQSIDRVEVSTDGGVSWQTAVGTSTWSYDWNIASGEGTYQILSRAINGNGDVETAGTGHTVTVGSNLPAPVTLDPIVTPTRITPVVLSGGKEAGTAVYINGTLAVPLDEATVWSHSQALSEGINHFSIVAWNASDDSSVPVEVSIALDTQAPVLISIAPENGSYVSLQPDSIMAVVQDDNSGLDNDAIFATALVTRGSGDTVAGSWRIDNDILLIFTPDSPLTEDTYTISATLRDVIGNTAPLAASFTYDATPPAVPTVDPVTSPTFSNVQIISGTKEADSSIWINGIEVVPVDTDTTWSHQVSLQPGLNTFTLYAQDRAYHQSGPRSVEITYDDTAPPPVDVLTIDAADTGSVAKLDWSAYDEAVHGDIAGYRVYYSSQPFTDVGELTPVASLPAGTKSYDLTGLLKGQSYYVAVVAYDSNGSANPEVSPVTAIPTDVVPPEDVTDPLASVGADSVTLSWTHSANTQGDLSAYKVYFNNDAGTSLAANVNNRSYTGLSPATSYPVRITAIDADGNESTGISLTVVTLLPNPTGLAGIPHHDLVELTWNHSQPSQYVKQYAIYVETVDFGSVDGLTPKRLVDPTSNSARVAGLSNGTTYYFAVTAINLSDEETTSVATISAVPEEDQEGPTISDFTFDGATLIESATITGAGTLAVSLSDDSGISRVEFLLDGAPLATDIDGADGYTAYWDLPDTPDGVHALAVTAYDQLDNPSTITRNINIALAAPPAPTISAPTDGTTTNQTSVTVTGSAELRTEVLLQVNGAQVAGPLALDGNNRFRAEVGLNTGANAITASARNRGGPGPASAAVNLTLDTSVPDTPLGLNAQSQTEGQVLLTWNRSADARVASYDIYRSGQSFGDISQAVKANSNPVTANRFVDLPLAEGTFYYRVIALNDQGTHSPPSNESSALADSDLPRAVRIDYAPQGNFDAATGRMAAGRVDVTVEVSEPLLNTPFLSLTPPGGVPITINLSQTSATGYAGRFQITDTTPSGTAYAVFSARDRVGNRGDAIDEGASILIDTAGPAITQLTLAPASPIENDQAAPVDVNLEFTLDQPVKIGTQPAMNYLLSGTGRQATAITNLVQSDTLVWRGSFQLPADAGLTEVEGLTFEFAARDDLDTLSHVINAGNSYQVYQGSLPPADIPSDLTATALAGGRADLQWSAIADANEYQIFRQAPGESALTAYNRVPGNGFTDSGLVDGEYRYSVASVRQVNAQESVSGQSDTVTVTADSLAPLPPENLSLELVGAGIKAVWDAPTGNSETLHYNLYRAGGTILTDISGLTPIRTDIVADGNGMLGYIDTAPDENATVYAVTAVDAVGNESAPSDSAYLNVDLLPVADLQVRQTDGGYPELSWSHNGSTVAGYNLYLDGSATPVNQTLLTATTYSDPGYTGSVRSYTVAAVDNNAVESPGRTVALAPIDVSPVSADGIRRGIMNRAGYRVSNPSASALSGVTLQVDVEGHLHTSTAFDLAAGESRVVEMIIGGFDTLPDNAALVTTVTATAPTGERAEIVENGQIAVGEATLLAQIETQELTRGTGGQIRFSLENTRDVVTEILTAQGDSPSPEISILLEDLDGNVLASAPFRQQLGSGVLTLSDGSTVARIEPGARFTSDWFALPIPQSAPDRVRIRLRIDRLHYHLGQADHLAIAGLGTSQDGVLSDTAYTAAIGSITPASSDGTEPILIAGRAVARDNGQPIPSAPVKLFIAANGFERQTEVTTDSFGGYQYPFDPLPGESGIFTVSAVHPDSLARPGQGQFTINRVLIKPTALSLNLPKNYVQTVDVIRADSGVGNTATNLRLVYEAADQPGGVYPPGITLTPGAPLNLQPGQSASLSFTIVGDNTADSSGAILLKVMSDESGDQPLALVNLEYHLSEAVPALWYTPSFVETGVAHDGSVNESVTLENRGMTDLADISVTLLTDSDAPPPNWIYLTSPQSQGNLASGETRQIQLTANPTNLVPDGLHTFKLRVESSNYPTTDINIYVAVTQSGIGNVLFKASDIYTATLDVNGVPIPGLAGTRILVQHEELTDREWTGTTDDSGEALFSDLPAGRYRFRASAPNHEDLLGRLTIKPGVTATQEIFLDFNLVTVEWSVSEITLEDQYEITLQAIFETDVPAPVVVFEPASTTLPEMGVGDVFYGEMRLTNHGLIRADNLALSYPANDAYFQYEFLAELPDKLEAKESLLIPYRVTSLSPLEPDGTTTGGASCIPYSQDLRAAYSYYCANGQMRRGTAAYLWTSAVAANTGGCGGIVNDHVLLGALRIPKFGPPTPSPSSNKCSPKPDCDTCCAKSGPLGD